MGNRDSIAEASLYLTTSKWTPLSTQYNNPQHLLPFPLWASFLSFLRFFIQRSLHEKCWRFSTNRWQRAQRLYRALSQTPFQPWRTGFWRSTSHPFTLVPSPSTLALPVSWHILFTNRTPSSLGALHPTFLFSWIFSMILY